MTTATTSRDRSAPPSPEAATHSVRVLVVDDSAVVRGLIGRQLNEDPAIQVVGSAPEGEAAVREVLRQPVDVVVLDIEMPGMDGMTALPLILAARPGVRVIMASTLTRRNAEVSLRALQRGAADYIAKPEGSLAAADAFKQELIAKVKALAMRRPAPTQTAAPRLAPLAPPPRASRVRPAVVAIGASTGGPPALLRLFEDLRGSTPQPIFLTQHMPATFTTLLAEQLSRAGGRPCEEGRDGQPVVEGRCYVAPGGYHMTVAKSARGPVIRLDQNPPENFCRPAVDPLFRSLAEVYGSGVLGLILTGMGADGAKGCAAISAAGGRFAVQDEATSVVWGMPGAAAGTGLAERILPLSEIGPWLRRLTTEPPVSAAPQGLAR